MVVGVVDESRVETLVVAVQTLVEVVVVRPLLWDVNLLGLLLLRWRTFVVRVLRLTVRVVRQAMATALL